MIEVHNLDVEIDGYPLFSKVNLSLNAGDILHVRGVNGAGKTTLLQVIAGLIEPTKGRVRANGELGYIGHKLALDLSLTAKENLLLLQNHRGSIEKAEEALKKVGLLSYADYYISQLSQGQRKRLSLARFFFARKDYWLLDEPLASLDSHYQSQFTRDLLAYVRENQGAVMLTSHLNDNHVCIANKVLDLS